MLGLAVLLALAQPDAALAKNARAILVKHCAKCHGPGQKRGGFDVLDWKAMRSAQVVPKKHEQSELFWLVDAGNMPPGDNPAPSSGDKEILRKWVDAGAPPVPSGPVYWGDEYVLKQVMSDWNGLPAAAKANARYVTLDHLLALPDGEGRRDAARKELERVLPALGKPGLKGFKLEAIDKQASVFRIDLAALGWAVQPFVIPVIPRRGPPELSPLTIFDLLLLEYPYAVASFQPPYTAAMGFLVATGSVRPIVYVRGDWLLGLLNDRKFAREISLLSGNKDDAGLPAEVPGSVWGGPVTPEQMRVEAGWKGDRARLEEALRGERIDPGKPLARGEWQAKLPAVVKQLGLGTPLLPLDGVTVAELSGDPGFTVKAWTIGYELGKEDDKGKLLKKGKPLGPKEVFKIGEGLALNFTPSKEAFVEVALQDHDLLTEPMLRRAVPGAETYSLNRRGLGYEVEDAPSEEAWIVYTFAGMSGPAGETHRARGFKKKVRDRFVHPLYRLADNGRDFDRPVPAMAKATAAFRCVKE